MPHLTLLGRCAAIVDQLTFGGNIIETGTDSYRLAHSKAQADSHDQQRQSRPAKR
jgi:hypothetical protein